MARAKGRKSGAGSKLGLERLDTLSPAHRARVENALKATLDREIGGRAIRPGGIGPMADHQKESGPLHGKDHDKKAGSMQDEILERITTLDDRAFKALAARVATIRNTVKPEG